MDIEDYKKNHGYLVLPRHSKLLLHELGYDLFGFYLSLIMLAVWFRGNKNFCRIVKSQTEIAKELNIHQSTVSRRFEALEEHKYFVIRHSEHIILGYLPLFLFDVNKKIHSKNYADIHSLYADVYQINADLQNKYAFLQESRGKNTLQRLNSSSKDNSGSFESITSEENDDSYYDSLIHDDAGRYEMNENPLEEEVK